MADKSFTIRDNRKRGHYRIDNEFMLEGYAAILKPYGIAAYDAIVLHVGANTQQGWPSYGRIASLTGMTRRQAIFEVKRLEEMNLINVERSGHETNCITLIDQSEWKLIVPKPRIRKKVNNVHPPVVNNVHPPVVNNVHPPVVNNVHPPSEQRSPKQNLINNTEEFNNTQQQQEKPAVAVVDHINFLIRKTKKGDPISIAYLEKLCKIHQTTQEQVLICAQALAAIPSIHSIPAVMLGAKNGYGYDSSCFYDGICVLAQAAAEPEPEPQPDEPQRDFEQEARAFAEYVKGLDDATHQTLMRKAETKLAEYKTRMNPKAYQETLQISFAQEVRAYANEHAA
jgi:hypothetical protein